MFQNDQTAALADATRRIAPDLPAEFGDTFDNAVTTGIEWHNSVASQFAKEHALNDYIGYVRDNTGETLPNPGYLIGGASLDEFNEKQSKIADTHPDLNLQPLTAADIDTMTRRRMAKVHDDSKAMSARERTWGGTFGNLGGGFVASFTDPVMLATLPLGGMGELGIAGRALEFGAIGAGTEAAVDLAQASYRERAVPGSSKEIPGEILSAGLFGLAIGGFFGTLGRLLKAGSKPLPTSVRDDVNVATSEAQINAANVFPSAAGETAGRDAITQAVTQAAKGERITAGDGFDQAHIDAFAAAAGAHDAESLALAGERAQRPITFSEKPDLDRFDPIPGETEDTASYWNRWLESATPEERRAVGATDEPSLFDARPVKAEPLRAAPEGLTADSAATLADDPATYEAVQRNLDRIRLEKPDAEFSVQVRMPDGNYQLVSRPLEDVLADIEAMGNAGKELMACATGMMAAE